ncbi:MAG: metallophosphoesterase [Methylacidiphilales bacterium]|nr:metallophosphoesterase [Candidatus Methylacidiphilales bacterium]
MPFRPSFPPYSRRDFLRQLLGAGAVTLAGFDSLSAQPPGLSTPAFRFAFLTDIHLMKGGALRSAEGMAACLKAVEALQPRPEFILVGGDLVHLSRDMAIHEAEQNLKTFLQIWNDHTDLPAHWVFGNHDLAGTSNPAASTSDRHYGKKLFQSYLKLPHLFYSFDHKGWHFVVLDDIAPQPDRSYIGQFFDDELGFLRADLDAHKAKPTIICCHIPAASNLSLGLILAHAATGHQPPKSRSLVCVNGQKLVDDFPGHNVRAVLSGHLHHFEQLEISGVPIINSGAVCGSYWRGPMYGCPEGFGVVDLGTDGSVKFDYRDFGWKAA